MTLNDTSPEQLQHWFDADVYDVDGDKIGNVNQLYLDDDTGRPEWVTVSTGLFGTKSSFVPVGGSTVTDGELRVAVTKDQVKGAPRVEDDGQIDTGEEQALYDYYGLRDGEAVNGKTSTITGTADEGGTRGSVAHEPDHAMTRSEEELRVGTERREAGRAKLRKYIVTEHQQVTVPVTHEEVRVETEPITDANRDRALDGPDITENVQEVTLHEEVPVVETKVVAKERVRLVTETVTEERAVEADVRKERIDTEGVAGSDG